MGHFAVSVLSVVLVSLFATEAAGKGATGVVKVVSDPQGASVYLNGRIYGPTPVLVELKAGTHSIVVSKDGYPPKVKKVFVLSGRVTSTKVTLKEELSKPGICGIRVHDLKKGGLDAGPGTVMVSTEPPGLTVVIDNKELPKTTPVAFDIHSGVYHLKIKQDGSVVLEKTIFVRAGRTAELQLSIKKRRSIDDMDPWQ